MQNFKLTLEYDGTGYHGWQAQPGLPTIQGVLQETVKRISGEEVRITGAGRTDAGVHALGQVANFRTAKDLFPDRWQRALNGLLPPDIVVRGIERAAEDFEARRSATHKTYRYRILNTPYPPALERHWFLHIVEPLDPASMAEAAAALIGEHDFSAFRAADGEQPTSVRRVCEARFVTERNRLDFVITANGFLKHMIRIVVGTLLDVGRGRLTPEHFRHILHSKDRQRAGRTAPPHGLCLMRVGY
ncbi:MAG: tRNA pseudouridine(38-40) synthase TruA [Candidatus Methylomirabilales bacterium]